ncbi:RDD family protein [Aridibaculum aurantiacum]|uniref:RDD family protein n=1 Tax=Aridibaculum aurantiacum TaxID=2810307 RepID=UPI001A95A5D3|nr:RDD family protein [Aridibaculum aurantiacum]
MNKTLHQNTTSLKEASKKKRLINFIIDTTIWFLLLNFLGYLAREYSSLEYVFMALMWALMFGAYSITTEYFLGKTPGKYFTRTRVVFKQNVEPEFRLILIRTWSRALPFEFLSLALGADAKAWHDTLSKTMVVDDH